MHPGNYSLLGVGVSFGVSAKALHPDRNVVVISGDGAFLSGGLSIESAFQDNLPITIVIDNNGGLDCISQQQERLFASGKHFATDFRDIPFHAMCEGMGGHGELVETRDQLAPACSAPWPAARSPRERQMPRRDQPDRGGDLGQTRQGVDRIMATLTSHTLNGSDGTHAGGIPVTLTQSDHRDRCFTARWTRRAAVADHPPAKIDPDATYELVFDTGAYWAARNMPATGHADRAALCHARPGGAYHMPVILNPNSYSMWTSA
jgi:5-hydroxyisourate hydrolase-like protein (transthyretin family)